ncbi:DUF5677 domain-containing protein [Kitasatospora sp. NPDC057692]|uniref:DUF5677 domain-containing protein n=1 Tax=Kitasatospora sp. NPDC057692 TaxID=3346215 RepID=UPI00369BCDB2
MSESLVRMVDEAAEAVEARRVAGAHATVAHLAGVLDKIGSGSIEVHQPTHDVFIVAWGWWARLVRSGQAVSLLSKSGFAHESSPIARSIVEHTLHLSWLVDSGPDAVAALEEERTVNASKLIKSIEAAAENGWQVPEGVERPTLPVKGDEHPLLNETRSFEDLCTLFGAPGVYVVYRVLSDYVHPSLNSAEQYLHGNLDGTASIGTTAQGSHPETIIQAAYCLIQATRTLSELVVDDGPLREAAERASELLGHVPGMPARLPKPPKVERGVPLRAQVTAPDLETAVKLADIAFAALEASGLVKLRQRHDSGRQSRSMIELEALPES